MKKVSTKKRRKRERERQKLKRLAISLTFALLLLAPSVFIAPRAEAASTEYNYLSKIDRDLMKLISNSESQSVDTIVVASRGLDSVRQLVLSYGGTVRFSLESINALAVTVPSTSVESVAKSSSVKKIWLDQQVSLKAQADVSNIKADLIQSIINKVADKKARAETTGGDKAFHEGLNP